MEPLIKALLVLMVSISLAGNILAICEYIEEVNAIENEIGSEQYLLINS